MIDKNLSYEYDRYICQWLTQIGGLIVFASKRQRSVFTLSVDKDGGIVLKRSSIPNVKCLVSGKVRQGTDQYLCLVSSGQHEIVKRTEQLPKTEEKFNALVPSKLFNSQEEIGRIDMDASGTIYAVTVNPLAINVYPINGEKRVIKLGTSFGERSVTGFTLRDDKPGYVVLVDRAGRGLVYGIQEREIIVEDLSLPRDCIWSGGQLYLLEAGTGYFGRIDLPSKRFIKERFLPGFLRGLTFVDNFAVIGSSFDRYESLFLGTDLGSTLKREKVQDRCGLYMVSLDNYDVVHSLMFLNGLFEIDAVCFVPTRQHQREMELFELSLPDNFGQVLGF